MSWGGRQGCSLPFTSYPDSRTDIIFNGKSLVSWGLGTCEPTQLQALV